MCTSYVCIPYIFTASHLASSHLTSSHLASAHLTSILILLRPAALATKNSPAATFHEMRFDRPTSRKSTEIQAQNTSFLPNLLLSLGSRQPKLPKQTSKRNSKCENIKIQNVKTYQTLSNNVFTSENAPKQKTD